ncbi:bifunctional pyr operon transcriptional regulator/uracil phosphoribosyltransferase PyrR [Zoogloea sp. LCSB751]|uniref:bifunctional pyr operon transcriptional regulator/uracil phosphoribosyltransferase PyrR n=1 Tax=Zoogloea sp. LCSB751 TaxID=1965277 RepID=UPI0009A51389|nr:bifunctional pyr operon transcriptional regulator/uracil phosphoribosyltransferase PyrR [Zoogloea sp. LCSB751]
MQLPEAEQLIGALAESMRPHVSPATCLVGIHTGGVWLAERLHALLGLSQPLGSIDVSFYRDDYAAKGLHPQPQGSKIPFDVEGTHIVIVDDVLYTGRTTRAALNELFDYGRPSRVDLAVLIDRGGRELPIAASFCALTLPEPLPTGQNLQLERDDSGALTMRLIHA